MTTIRVPVTLSDYNTIEFLESIEPVFQLVGRSLEGFCLRYDRVKKISLFSQLLLYKFISYTAKNKCFSNPTFRQNEYVVNELMKSGFFELIQSHFQESGIAEEVFKKYKVHYTLYEDKFFLAPLKLLRTDELRFKHIQHFTTQVNKFYNYSSNIVSLVSTCLCEIYMNFWEHATEDSGTIMVALGDKASVEIMFADNGEGIRTNLLKAGYSAKKLLELAIRRGVTSKKGTDHMGWGLWLVAQLCQINQGTLEIFSEGEALIVNPDNIYCRACGYWKGTIIHLKIPLSQPRFISDLRLPELNPSIQINWS